MAKQENKAEAPVKKVKPVLYEVLKPFRDAVTKQMREPGDEVEISDETRLQKLFDKGILLNPEQAAE